MTTEGIVSDSGVVADLTPQRFSFYGTGSEYFRIWIVNLLLSILTLGIYSAWAKVRRTRYFYSSTALAGSRFEYHGNPIAILKGRIIAVVLVGSYQIALKFSPGLGLLLFVLLASIFPWLIWKSFQFKLHNTSYRGIRFGFAGSAGKAYFHFLLLPILTLFTVYLLAPFTHQRIKRFQHTESRFGTSPFAFAASAGNFYLAYLKGFLLMLAGFVLIFALSGAGSILLSLAKHTMPEGRSMVGIFMAIFSSYVWLILAATIFFTLIQNLIWNNTLLEGHQFKSELKSTRIAFIILTNILGVIFTVGLFIPFAHVRLAKYRIESLSLLPAASLDTYIADAQANVAATGEGVSDILDFDLSF